MAGVNIRESRRAAHPASKYDGVNSFETDRIPVAYTADQLMRHLAKRQMEEQKAKEMEAAGNEPSYFENMLSGAASSFDPSIYDKYKPQRQYSYADRLAALKAAAPENRAAILEMTAPSMPRMKKGWGALGEAILPAAIAGTTHANSKRIEQEALKRLAAQEIAKQGRKDISKYERMYVKNLMDKEKAVEIENLKSARKGKNSLTPYQEFMMQQSLNNVNLQKENQDIRKAERKEDKEIKLKDKEINRRVLINKHISDLLKDNRDYIRAMRSKDQNTMDSIKKQARIEAEEIYGSGTNKVFGIEKSKFSPKEEKPLIIKVRNNLTGEIINAEDDGSPIPQGYTKIE